MQKDVYANKVIASLRREFGGHLTAKAGAKIKIYHSLPVVVDPEISEPVEWTIGLTIPHSVFEPYVGPIGKLSGQRWRANFNKCADGSSHPSCVTWNKVTERNFHRPWEFGELRFE